MARGKLRFLFKHGLALRRLDLGDSATPALPPLNVLPSAAPSGTAQSGDIYFDSTTLSLKVHDGVGFVPSGGRRIVKSAVATLTPADSGALCVFNSAAGDIYTLPTAAAGLWFDFVVLTTITSNAAKVITASASEFLLGGFRQSTDGTYVTAEYAANGSSIRAVSMNGTTTGGYAQDWFRVVGLSATQWYVHGFGRATGAEATPFAAS